MSETIDRKCTDPESHQLHICQLVKRGLTEEIAVRTNAPGYICHNCNHTANRAEDLCNCSPLIKRA